MLLLDKRDVLILPLFLGYCIVYVRKTNFGEVFSFLFSAESLDTKLTRGEIDIPVNVFLFLIYSVELN